MKRFIGCVLLVSTLLACAPAEPARMTEARRHEIESAVAGFLDHYHRTLGGGDPEAIRGLFVQDGRFAHLEDGSRRYPSPEDIVRGLANLPAGSSIATEHGDVEILVLTETLAYVSSSFVSEMTFPDVPTFTVHGVHSSLLEQAEGRWRMVRGHSSSVREAADW